MEFEESTTPNGIVKRYTRYKNKNNLNYFVVIARTAVNNQHFVPHYDDEGGTWTTEYQNKEGIIVVSVDDNSYQLKAHIYNPTSGKRTYLKQYLGPDMYGEESVLAVTKKKTTFSLDSVNDPKAKRYVGKWYKISNGDTKLKIKAYKTDNEEPWDDIIPAKTTYEEVEIMFLPVNFYMKNFGKSCKTFYSTINLEGLSTYIALTRLNQKIDCTGKWGFRKDGCIYTINSDVNLSSVKCEKRFGYIYGDSTTKCGGKYIGTCSDPEKRCYVDKGAMACIKVPKKKKEQESTGTNVLLLILIISVVIVIVILVVINIIGNDRARRYISRLFQ